MTLREHVTFGQNTESGSNPAASPGAQYQHTVVVEQTKQVSLDVLEGHGASDELWLAIPATARNPTVQGRFIEVTFTLSVKAFLEHGRSVEVIVPVLMSPWSNEVSRLMVA
ncbi:hypothetical protein CALCODRAFT_496488 [Calocera cornea HHB12733]|uniref:Uncharacterized protein n=1 Tax=Calocera cornea HHB12733 TaxID=1353952 RepID=A0A165FTM6_9BASI|nr:hypothetical protein CALCODRAFT_496488 [Calocera cornea HHB12733]